MRTILNYLRSLFCKHEFIKDEYHCERSSEFGRRSGYRVSLICNKCGYHKSFWKF